MDEPMRERLRHEAAAWVWVPPDAEDRTTDEYRLTLYPERTSVQWSATDRLPALVEEFRGVARGRGQPLRWWVNRRTAPEDTAEVLTSSGFEVVETLDVLGRPLAGTVEALDVPDDVRVEPADDEDAIRLAGELGGLAFGEPGLTPAQLADEVARSVEARRRGRWEVRRFLARLGDEPVGQAGYTLTGRTLRLWGGAVDEGARGRGVYRALLAARAEDGLRQGADLALVKGRVETSAPILRRAGFETVGRETCFEDRA